MRYSYLAIALLGMLAAWFLMLPVAARTHVVIMDAWIIETSGQRAVLNVRIANTGRYADRLTRVSTRLAEKVTIVDQGGREARSLPIVADSEWLLGSGAPRIELVGLTESLTAGGHLHFLFVFETAGKIDVDVVVKKE
jgi:copper(I)-binding protein